MLGKLFNTLTGQGQQQQSSTAVAEKPQAANQQSTAKQVAPTQTPPQEQAAPAAPTPGTQQTAENTVVNQGIIPGTQTQAANPAQSVATAQQAIQKDEQARKILLDVITGDIKRDNGGTLQTTINSLEQLLTVEGLATLSKELSPKDPETKAEQILTSTIPQSLVEQTRKYTSAVRSNEAPEEIARKKAFANEAINVLVEIATNSNQDKKIVRSAIQKLLEVASEGTDPSDGAKITSATKEIASKAFDAVKNLVKTNPQDLADTLTLERGHFFSRWNKTYDFVQQGTKELIASLIKLPEIGNRMLNNLRAQYTTRHWFGRHDLADLKIAKNAIEEGQKQEGLLDANLAKEVLDQINKGIQRVEASNN